MKKKSSQEWQSVAKSSVNGTKDGTKRTEKTPAKNSGTFLAVMSETKTSNLYADQTHKSPAGTTDWGLQDRIGQRHLFVPHPWHPRRGRFSEPAPVIAVEAIGGAAAPPAEDAGSPPADDESAEGRKQPRRTSTPRTSHLFSPATARFSQRLSITQNPSFTAHTTNPPPKIQHNLRSLASSRLLP